MTTFNDVMDADDRERPQREADRRLGAAWRRCEEVLPAEWIGPILEPKYTRFGKIVVVDYQAVARNDRAIGVAPSARIGTGPTPADALETLADKLVLFSEVPA